MRPFSGFGACSYQIGDTARQLKIIQIEIKSRKVSDKKLLLIAPVYEILFGLNFAGPLFIVLINVRASFQQPPAPQAEIAAE
jgi:hypothetical protein